jgi:DNA-binding NtrC family response regulator
VSKSVLIIEDEVLVSSYFKKAFERRGFTVVSEIRVGELIRNVEPSKVDLIVCDIKLAGDWDGIATVRFFLEKKEVPVIFVSAFANYHDNSFMKNKNVKFVTKPVRAEKIVDLAQQILR